MPAVTRTPRLTPEERSAAARIGGRARFAAMTPEQQRAFQQRAGMASRVNNLIRRIAELTPGQRQRLRAALCGDCEPPEAGCDQ